MTAIAPSLSFLSSQTSIEQIYLDCDETQSSGCAPGRHQPRSTVPQTEGGSRVRSTEKQGWAAWLPAADCSLWVALRNSSRVPYLLNSKFIADILVQIYIEMEVSPLGQDSPCCCHVFTISISIGLLQTICLENPFTFLFWDFKNFQKILLAPERSVFFSNLSYIFPKLN